MEAKRAELSEWYGRLQDEARVDQLRGELADLDAQLRAAVREQYDESYVAAANADIDDLNARMANADAQARAKMVEAIEKGQAKLEKLKRKLQN